MHWQIDKKRDKQIDRHTDRQTDWLTHIQTVQYFPNESTRPLSETFDGDELWGLVQIWFRLPTYLIKSYLTKDERIRAIGWYFGRDKKKYIKKICPNRAVICTPPCTCGQQVAWLCLPTAKSSVTVWVSSPLARLFQPTIYTAGFSPLRGTKRTWCVTIKKVVFCSTFPWRCQKKKILCRVCDHRISGEVGIVVLSNHFRNLILVLPWWKLRYVNSSMSKNQTRQQQTKKVKRNFFCKLHLQVDTFWQGFVFLYINLLSTCVSKKKLGFKWGKCNPNLFSVMFFFPSIFFGDVTETNFCWIFTLACIVGVGGGSHPLTDWQNVDRQIYIFMFSVYLLK